MTEFNWNTGFESSDDAPHPEPESASDAHLTRREIRAREQAAATQPLSPQPLFPQAPAPAPAPMVSSFSDSVADSTSTNSVKAPKKPKLLRPVRTPRGTSRPSMTVPASRTRPVAPSQRKPFKRRMLSKLMTFGAMIGAGLIMVSTSIPANAFFSPTEQTGAVSAPAEAKVQALVAQPDAAMTVARDGYTATSFKEQLFLKYGNRSFLYTNDPNGTIQWPFPIAVPITDGYGPRVAPCDGCSTFHKGVDFTPGYGAHIQAIADGVVIKVDDVDWSYGQHVEIEHLINGQKVVSLYAHMQVGSIKVVVGQAVKVGDEIGLVGTTGESTGPHLHLEIHINGVAVDPFAWLKANAN